jgi:hypothetical protein
MMGGTDPHTSGIYLTNLPASMVQQVVAVGHGRVDVVKAEHVDHLVPNQVVDETGKVERDNGMDTFRQVVVVVVVVVLELVP